MRQQPMCRALAVVIGVACLGVAACGGGNEAGSGGTPSTAANPPAAPAAPNMDYFGVAAPAGEVNNKMEDVRHDLMAAIRGTRGATADLAGDLAALSDHPPAASVLDPLAQHLSASLAGSSLKEDSPELNRIAQLLYVSLQQGALDERRLPMVQADMEGALKAANAPAAQISAVRQDLSKLADAMKQAG